MEEIEYPTARLPSIATNTKESFDFIEFLKCFSI
jgi:hypothetical protein